MTRDQNQEGVKQNTKTLTTWFWAHTDTTPLEIEHKMGLIGCHCERSNAAMK